MTVSAQTPINRSTGNGVTTVFPYTFKIIAAGDIEVSVDDVVKTLNVDYTVSGAGVDAGGNVTMTTAPANLTTVVRRRNMALVRTTDYQDQGTLPADTLDNDIDAPVLMIQQLDERLGRTFALPASSSANAEMPAPTAGYVLGWDALGENLVNLPGQVGSSLIDLAAPSGASLVGYLPAGTEAVPTTVQAKLRESVSIMDFEDAAATGGDWTTAIQAALNTGKSVLIPDGTFGYTGAISYTADGQSIFGDGYSAILRQDAATAYINTNGKNGVSLRKLKVIGTGASGLFRVTSTDVRVDTVYFYEGSQRVWLYTSDRVIIRGCTFNHTGYGVIIQSGYVADHVTVNGNIAFDMISDFVEANSASVKCKMWTISNNIYAGNISYPTVVTEGRFVGITEVEGVIISGNTIEKSAGDAAIHLEDLYGETIISGNVFDNCAGENGYIYVLNSAENTLIDNNIFKKTDAGLPASYAVSLGSGSYANVTTFTNNRVVGLASGGTLSGLNIASQSGACTLISNNVFDKLDMAVYHKSSYAVSVLGNRVLHCAKGIYLGRDATSNAGRDWLVSGNVFDDTLDNVYTGSNTSGTNGPKRWTLSGNVFSGTVTIFGGGAVASSGDAEDITVTNNVFIAGATLGITGTASRRIRFNNIFQDAAIGGGASLCEDLRNYANDAAAAVGLVPVGGMYRNGSVVQVRVV